MLAPSSLAIILASTLFPQYALSFGTVNGPLGQHAEHEKITRAALECRTADGKSDGICFEAVSLDQVAGKAGTYGAVGAPDFGQVGVPEGPHAHCDDADFLGVAGYPQNRAAATNALRNCTTHLRARFKQGWGSAVKLLNSKNQIKRSETDISDTVTPDGQPQDNSCTFSLEALQVSFLGRAKCNTLEGFGRALHGVQDFYSHSNWVDHADPNRPIDATNPPGLSLSTSAAFLNLRATNDIGSLVPLNLSTGCFYPNDTTPGTGGILPGPDCTNRITHHTLNKDHGLISAADGSTSNPGPDTPRGVIGENFDLAVKAAIADTKLLWARFRSELKLQHGASRANLMICALVRDEPWKDCANRKISLVVDKSGSNFITDPSDLRIAAAEDLASRLVSAADAQDGTLPDSVAVIGFDSFASVIYPMGDPDGAVFTGLEAGGGTDIGSGISVGINEIMKDEPGKFANRAGIVVLTDGEDGNPANQIAQLERAKSLGVRVNFGFLDPVAVPIITKRGEHARLINKRDPSEDIMQAILATGGIFATIGSAEAQKKFINLVLARGATNVDSDSGDMMLAAGVGIVDVLKATDTARTFAYSASAGENITFMVQVKSTGVELHASLRNIRENAEISSAEAFSGSDASLQFVASARADLELVVTRAGVNVTGLGDTVFSVGINTNMPDKNETTTTSSTVSSTESLTYTNSSTTTTASNSTGSYYLFTNSSSTSTGTSLLNP